MLNFSLKWFLLSVLKSKPSLGLNNQSEMAPNDHLRSLLSLRNVVCRPSQEIPRIIKAPIDQQSWTSAYYNIPKPLLYYFKKYSSILYSIQNIFPHFHYNQRYKTMPYLILSKHKTNQLIPSAEQPKIQGQKQSISQHQKPAKEMNLFHQFCLVQD